MGRPRTRKDTKTKKHSTKLKSVVLLWENTRWWAGWVVVTRGQFRALLLPATGYKTAADERWMDPSVGGSEQTKFEKNKDFTCKRPVLPQTDTIPWGM